VKQHGPLLEEVLAVGASPSLISARRELAELNSEPVHELKGAAFRAQTYHAGKSLWIVVSWPDGGEIAICPAYAPLPGTTIRELAGDDTCLRLDLCTELGVYHVTVEVPSRKRPLFHWRTTLTPADNLILDHQPPDLYPLGEERDPLAAYGAVHTSQKQSRGQYCMSRLRGLGRVHFSTPRISPS
jgi:hypothetical protein